MSACVDGTLQTGEADIGHSTWDVGLPQDFGLEVRDLRKSFESPTGDRIEVLRSVSFSVSPGEIIAIVGASGAGKSTLLNLLGGLDTPDHGSVSVGNFAVNAAPSSTLARFRNQRLGFIFQFHHLMLDLTAAENVSLPLMIRRTPRAKAISRANEMLARAGLADRSAHLVTHLSGGEQQRVAVCRALITLPSVVLADEPTGNLDATNSDSIAQSLTDYARKHGTVVVIATHNPKLADLCDRTLRLHDGRLSPA
jgi:lipoprotein-releasing system ATP-binding protein